MLNIYVRATKRYDQYIGFIEHLSKLTQYPKTFCQLQNTDSDDTATFYAWQHMPDHSFQGTPGKAATTVTTRNLSKICGDYFVYVVAHRNIGVVHYVAGSEAW